MIYNKKRLIKIIGLFGILIIINLYFVIGADTSSPQVTYCCEKTKTGAYCKNEPQEKCDQNYKMTPSSCEATSFCKRGCCYDNNEGLCIDGTPQEACKISNGVWTDTACSSSPQCNLGCCILGQQSAFTTLIRCKKLSSMYGLETDFKSGIQDEISCVDLAGAQDIGACVFEKDFQKTCKFTTRGDCETSKKKVTNDTTVGFHKDYLCTAPELETICQPTKETKCIGGKDGVYFIDSCGNPANIYDSSKIWDTNKGSSVVIDYWSKVKKKSESCSVGKNNINSKSCGNCDYLSGSICTLADKKSKPLYGNSVCKDINCKKTSNGKDYKNGESWCYWDDNNPNNDNVGSRHFRHICLMGEEVVEPCADYRNQVCIQSSIDSESGKFLQAGCAVNRWQECILINSSDDCLNKDKRDCTWLDLNSTKLKSKEVVGVCLPEISPGLVFWNSGSGASSQCSFGARSCTVKYEKGLLGGKKKCKENCDCCTEEAGCNKAGAEKLKEDLKYICSKLGDCGPEENYVGVFVDKGYKITVKKDEKNEKDGSSTASTAGQGGAAQPSTAASTATTTPVTPPSGSQTFAGSGNQTVFGGSSASQAANPSGNVIQGLMISSFNKIAAVSNLTK